jgi:hypothetical protein
MQSILRLTKSSLRSTPLLLRPVLPPPIVSRSLLSFSSKYYYSTPSSSSATPPSATTTDPAVNAAEEFIPKKTAIGKINRRLQITFTCTAAIIPPPPDDPSPAVIELKNDGSVVEGIVNLDQTEVVPVSSEGEGIQEEEESICGYRSTHEFSRISYEKGIVLIECPGCKNRHLIGEFSLCLLLK